MIKDTAKSPVAFNRRPLPAVPEYDAGVLGLRAHLETLPHAELLDQYAVLASLPGAMADVSCVRLALIREILLDRLEGAA